MSVCTISYRLGSTNNCKGWGQTEKNMLKYIATYRLKKPRGPFSEKPISKKKDVIKHAADNWLAHLAPTMASNEAF